jgi:hypothetical protein
MRAKEFIQEQKNKPSKRQHYASVGMNTFTNTNYDRTYDLNRVMMAVASTDGKSRPNLEGESWAAKQNTAHPYTEVEQNMLEIAFDAAGIPYADLNKGDLKSHELPGTQTKSPIKPFKGYAR